MAVQFNGSSLLFQFVDLDLDTIYSSDPSFQEALNAPVFDPTDAIANLYVPRDWFSTMFWVKFPFEDLSDTNPMSTDKQRCFPLHELLGSDAISQTAAWSLTVAVHSGTRTASLWTHPLLFLFGPNKVSA